MLHPIYRVQALEVVAPFTLQLRFDDGLERRIDPATLHDWPLHEAAFRELAQRWEHASA